MADGYGSEDEYVDLTGDDWGKIHGKAWREKEFKEKLEQDPTNAILEYIAKEYPDLKKDLDGKKKKLRMVKLRPPPEGVDPDFLDDINPFPPSCC